MARTKKDAAVASDGFKKELVHVRLTEVDSELLSRLVNHLTPHETHLAPTKSNVLRWALAHFAEQELAKPSAKERADKVDAHFAAQHQRAVARARSMASYDPDTLHRAPQEPPAIETTLVPAPVAALPVNVQSFLLDPHQHESVEVVEEAPLIPQALPTVADIMQRVNAPPAPAEKLRELFKLPAPAAKLPEAPHLPPYLQQQRAAVLANAQSPDDLEEGLDSLSNE